MSINPLSNSLASILGSRPTGPAGTAGPNGAANPAAPGTADGARARVEQGAARPVAANQPPLANRAAATSIAQPAQATLPASPPPGTDPELWSVLTGEERAFFARVGSMGPLTYGRMTAASQPAPPAARGVRLDVKV